LTLQADGYIPKLAGTDWRQKPLQGQTQLVAALLMAHALLMGRKTHTVSQSAVAERSQASDRQNPQAATEAREFPAGEYARLRVKALSNANGKPGPRIRNPRLSMEGIDLATLAVLDEQRRYRRNSGEPGGTASPRRLTATAGSDLLRTALPFPSCLNPMIIAVNGRAVGPVFTPRRGDNHFRIEGCGFGNAPGEVRLESESGPISPNPEMQPIVLQPERAASWSENQIDVRLDPRLAGNPDSMATLVVLPADGRRIELHGCRFLALRGEPIILKTIAASWVKLSATSSPFHPIPQFEYVSPPTSGGDIPPGAAKMSALVIRSDNEAFGAGVDTYDFSALSPGWVVESIQVENYDVACPGDVTRTQQFGDASARVDDHGLTVTWASHTCSSFIPPIFRFKMASSEYAVKVWVTGPIGTDPVGVDRTQRGQKAELSSNSVKPRTNNRRIQ
jgi:hypothetical protein